MNKKILFLIFLTLLTLQTQRTQQTFSQWYKQQIPVNKLITGIKFLDTLNGWACTGNFLDTSSQNSGYIIHTTNGGNNWLIQFSRTPFAFSTMTMVNNMVGYAFGDSLAPIVGRTEFFKTTNGGANWFNISIPYNMWISQFYFLNPDTGWFADNGAASPDAQLTTDGGYTWQQRVNGMTDYHTRCIFFLNYNTGWCGSGLTIYKTTNAGANWILYGGFGSDYVYSIFFLNENIGWLGCGGDYIRYTSNSGINWIGQTLPYSSGATSSIFFLNNFTGYASDPANQRVLKTTNGGMNWGYQYDTGRSVYLAIVDSLHGWSTSYGSLYPYLNIVDYTKNGGGTITYIGIIILSNKIPEQYKLFQNYPNPFNPTTNIRFSLIKPSYIQIKIFDETGKEINPWIFGWYPEKLLEAGTHEFQFNGSGFASGTYFFRLIIFDEKSNVLYTASKKMILAK